MPSHLIPQPELHMQGHPTLPTQIPATAAQCNAANCLALGCLGRVKTCLTDASVTAHLQQSCKRGGRSEPTGLMAQIKMRAGHLYWYRLGQLLHRGSDLTGHAPCVPARLEEVGWLNCTQTGRAAAGPQGQASAAQPAACAGVWGGKGSQRGCHVIGGKENSWGFDEGVRKVGWQAGQGLHTQLNGEAF